jgi:hypothetical protein
MSDAESSASASSDTMGDTRMTKQADNDFHLMPAWEQRVVQLLERSAFFGEITAYAAVACAVVLVGIVMLAVLIGRG